MYCYLYISKLDVVKEIWLNSTFKTRAKSKCIISFYVRTLLCKIKHLLFEKKTCSDNLNNKKEEK